MKNSKRSCKYWDVCGNNENCKNCKGYETKERKK